MKPTSLIIAFLYGLAFAILPPSSEPAVAPPPPAEDAPPIPKELANQVPESGWTATGQITSVHDGDTVTVAVKRTYRVRLLDCWAPEITGPQKPEGLKSLQELQNVALGRKCTLFVPENADDIGKSTSMGRYLGRVWVNGRDISELQVERGRACKTKDESEKKFGPRSKSE